MAVNEKKIFEIAKKHTPEVKVEGKEGWLRHDVVSLLEGDNNIGIELGVAKGIFSKRMIESGKFSRFYGVDMYGDIHDTGEYVSTLKDIGLGESRYYLLRMDFDSALQLFDDEFFDFVYVDGFAHTGEEGGKTLVDWLRKVKVGGILAGDDYHNEWPLVVWAVNDLAKQIGVNVGATLVTEDTRYNRYPTWFIKKNERDLHPKVNKTLFELGMREKRRIHAERSGTAKSWRRRAGSFIERFRK